MKRLGLLCILLGSLALASCDSKISLDNAKEKIVNYIDNLESYSISGTMEIVRSENTIVFDVEAAYLSPSFYRVSFITQGNKNEQIIVKNSDGVYVLTPSLNKEFKFESEWPLNSSHAYLLGSIAKDVVSDSESTVSIEEDMFVLKACISHKTNQNLTYMKFYCDKSNFAPIKTVFYNSSDEACIRVTFVSFNANCKLDGSYFNVSKIMEEKTISLGEGYINEASGSLQTNYQIDGNSLILNSNKDETTILCYSGAKPYTIISKKVTNEDPLTVVRIYDELDITNEGIIAINGSSITYYYMDQEITILSSYLSIQEMINIAESISWA